MEYPRTNHKIFPKLLHLSVPSPSKDFRRESQHILRWYIVPTWESLKSVLTYRMTNLPGLSGTFLILALKVSFPRKPLSSRQMGMISHPRSDRHIWDAHQPPAFPEVHLSPSSLPILMEETPAQAFTQLIGSIIPNIQANISWASQSVSQKLSLEFGESNNSGKKWKKIH